MADFDNKFLIKFGILFVIWFGFIWFIPSMVPLTLKWKFTFTFAGFIGIGLGLMGVTLRDRKGDRY